MSHVSDSPAGSTETMSEAIGAFLTFTTYGTHLHGSETGSVSRTQRNLGAPMVPWNAAFRDQAKRLLQPEFTLEKSDRLRALHSVVNSCACRGWHLFCVHVRTNHIHVISQADVPVDQMLIYLKARATKELKAYYPSRQRFWTKRGSTRYLWEPTSLGCNAGLRN